MRIVLLVVYLVLATRVHAAESFIPEYVCEGVTVQAERSLCEERAAKVLETRLGTRTTDTPSIWGSAIWPAWWVLYYGFGLLVGRYIFRDAKQRPWLFLGVRPLWWSLLAVFDPAFGLLVYWAVHYSRFAQSYEEATTRTSATPAA